MPTILIVDDDADFRESFSETLEDLGHVPIVVPSGAAALRVLAQEQIDAVIVDYRMPDMDGIELLNIRARPTLAKLPAAMLTAHATSANTIAAMGLGAIDHLTAGRPPRYQVPVRMLPEGAAAGTKVSPMMGR